MKIEIKGEGEFAGAIVVFSDDSFAEIGAYVSIITDTDSIDIPLVDLKAAIDAFWTRRKNYK